MSAEIKSVGVLAGQGELPPRLIDHCLQNHIPVCAVQFNGCEYDWGASCPTIQTRLERVGEIFKFFKKNNVENVVMIGNLNRPDIASMRPDWRGVKTLGKIAKAMTRGGDDALLRTLRREIESEGFAVVGVDSYLDDLTADAVSLTVKKCDRDIDTAIQTAIQHGEDDKGQSILAHADGTYDYEGRDGTTALIKAHGRAGSTLVKMMKPQQDPDLDRPTTGIHTMHALHAAKCAGMVIQANAVFMVDKDDMIDFANQNGMFIEAVDV